MNTQYLNTGHKLLFSMLLMLSGFTLAAEQSTQIIDLGHAQLNTAVWESNVSNGETIIALPGSGGDVTRYRYLGPLLADAGYRVFAVNQRGIMGSTGELEGLTLHDYAADVAAIIDVLELQEAHLVGWALGNRTVRVVATDFPDKVASISLIAAGGLARPLTEPGELGKLLSDAGIDESEKMQLARRTLFSAATSEALVRDYVRDLNYWPQARRSQRQANANTPLEQWWAGGAGPMLIVQGNDDKTAPPENGIRMKQEFGERITLVNLPDAGHLLGMEKPRETVDAILTFLRENPYAAQD
jgi:pimeloyl-ACP methyl ester carboxylesterase